MPNLIAAMKEALARKNNPTPADNKTTESQNKVRPTGRPTVNKPVKKASARGR